ncbi:hypothetical protein Golax_000675 [Gossypium laxum]|uniref:Uncharacterized protein n=1 Tax=Gossypium laxum TaxID=34288 RepID=A0A7J9AUG5_9ROSI|nr:hypothetical protein [Gossypium laxum]
MSMVENSSGDESDDEMERKGKRFYNARNVLTNHLLLHLLLCNYIMRSIY